MERRLNDPWRQHVADDIAALKQGMVAGSARMGRIEGSITDNTLITADTKKKADEVYDILTSFKGGMKVLGWLGTAAKWITIVAGAVSAVFAAMVATDELGKHFPTFGKWLGK